MKLEVLMTYTAVVEVTEEQYQSMCEGTIDEMLGKTREIVLPLLEDFPLDKEGIEEVWVSNDQLEQ